MEYHAQFTSLPTEKEGNHGYPLLSHAYNAYNLVSIHLYVICVRVRERGLCTCAQKYRTREKCTWCHPFARIFA